MADLTYQSDLTMCLSLLANFTRAVVEEMNIDPAETMLEVVKRSSQGDTVIAGASLASVLEAAASLTAGPAHD